MGGWVKHQADKCCKKAKSKYRSFDMSLERDDKHGKVAKSKYESFVTSLERADKKTGRVGKKLIVHLPISVTKWVWMASLNEKSERFLNIQ